MYCNFDSNISRVILESANCEVVECNHDPFVKKIAANFSEKYKNNFEFFHKKFREIKSVIKTSKNEKVDGIILDLGMSNFQISDSE